MSRAPYESPYGSWCGCGCSLGGRPSTPRSASRSCTCSEISSCAPALPDPDQHQHRDPVGDAQHQQHHAEPGDEALQRLGRPEVDPGDDGQHAQGDQVEQHRQQQVDRAGDPVSWNTSCRNGSPAVISSRPTRNVRRDGHDQQADVLSVKVHRDSRLEGLRSVRGRRPPVQLAVPRATYRLARRCNRAEQQGEPSCSGCTPTPTSSSSSTSGTSCPRRWSPPSPGAGPSRRPATPSRPPWGTRTASTYPSIS